MEQWANLLLSLPNRTKTVQFILFCTRFQGNAFIYPVVSNIHYESDTYRSWRVSGSNYVFAGNMQFDSTAWRCLHMAVFKTFFHGTCIQSVDSFTLHWTRCSFPMTFFTCMGYPAPPRQLLHTRNRAPSSSTQVAFDAVSIAWISLRCLSRLFGFMSLLQTGQALFKGLSLLLWVTLATLWTLSSVSSSSPWSPSLVDLFNSCRFSLVVWS